jgi:hypothetical protein
MLRTTETVRKHAPPQGMVLWRGPSRIDAKPIAAVATGLLRPSANAATGPVVQIWIFRSRVPPMEAVRSGGDRSVCGDCLHRGTTCYVSVWREVTQVWRSFRQGRYPAFKPKMLAMFQGRAIRLGAYGDPAAVPIEAWRWLHGVAGLWLAYTHQWAQPWCDPALRELCMASVDSPAQRERALALGWKTFRTRTEEEPVLPGEFICPKSAEAGRRLLCLQCGACNGGVYTGQATPVTVLHGLPSLRRHFADDPRRFALSLPMVGEGVAP